MYPIFDGIESLVYHFCAIQLELCEPNEHSDGVKTLKFFCQFSLLLVKHCESETWFHKETSADLTSLPNFILRIMKAPFTGSNPHKAFKSVNNRL